MVGERTKKRKYIYVVVFVFIFLYFLGNFNQSAKETQNHPNTTQLNIPKTTPLTETPKRIPKTTEPIKTQVHNPSLLERIKNTGSYNNETIVLHIVSHHHWDREW